MSIAFISDLHLDNYKPFSKILTNGMNSRLLDQLNVVRKSTTIFEEKKPEAIIFLGDLFNGITESLPKIIYTTGYLAVQSWAKVAPLYLVVGNHDIYRGMHVLSTFESIPNVKVISKTTNVKIGGYSIDLLPWGDIQPKEPGDICAGHVEIFGAVIQAKSGYRFGEGADLSSFARYQFALFGHFHNPQQLIVPNSTCDCRYIGAIMQMDRRTSSNSALGVTLLDGGKLHLVEIESPRIYEYRIDTPEDKERFLNHTLDKYNYFRVVVTNPELDLPETLDRVLVEYDLPEVSTSRLSLAPDAGPWSVRLAEAAAAWIEQANTKLDKELLKKEAEELLKQ